MTVEQINKLEAKLNLMAIGRKQWRADIKLIKAKVACPEYQHPNQGKTFIAWLIELSSASKKTVIQWASEKNRADYYEGQPDTWLPYYDNGETPENAINDDLEYWQ